MLFMQRDDVARGGGWIGRAARILDECGVDAVESGYLAIPEGISQIEADPRSAPRHPVPVRLQLDARRWRGARRRLRGGTGRRTGRGDAAGRHDRDRDGHV
jgi:hypothetical protein